MIILIIIAILILALEILARYKNFKEKDEKYMFSGKLNDEVLTSNEQVYYSALKELLKGTEYIIFSKMRLADIIKANNYSDFNKIRGKHIDFIVCNKKTKPILFIELDDITHNRKKNFENDTKKNYIFNKVGIAIIRTSLKDLENNICEIKNKLGI